MRAISILVVVNLLTLTIAGQNRLLTKEPIDIKKTDFWKTIEKKSDYYYLDSLALYSITYISDDRTINGYLLEPIEPNKNPVVIFNRGGHQDFGRLTIQHVIEWLAPISRENYVVIASQYRDEDEFGGQDVNDVITLVDIVASLPTADTGRIAMYGWSRGGMMTYIALTKTCKIKAAIIGGAPTDLLEVAEKRPAMDRLFQSLIPAYRSEKATALKMRSAMYWPEKICKTTALLLIHGKNDWRVDPSQTINMEGKLRLLNRNCKMVLFDNNDHIINQNRKEKDELIIKWLKEYL